MFVVLVKVFLVTSVIVTSSQSISMTRSKSSISSSSAQIMGLGSISGSLPVQVRRGSVIKVTIHIKNTAEEARTFYVGASIIGEGEVTWKDLPSWGTTPVVNPNEICAFTLGEYTIPSNASLGYHGIVAKVWVNPSMATQLAERWFPQVVLVERSTGYVVLSFDFESDNESDKSTGYVSNSTLNAIRDILNLLSQKGIPATIFVQGACLENSRSGYEFKKVVSLAVSKGFEIASHSYSHPSDINGLTESDIEKEIVTTENLLKELSGTHPGGFRAPYFAYGEKLWNVLARKGYFYDSSVWQDEPDIYSIKTPSGVLIQVPWKHQDGDTSYSDLTQSINYAASYRKIRVIDFHPQNVKDHMSEFQQLIGLISILKSEGKIEVCTIRKPAVSVLESGLANMIFRLALEPVGGEWKSGIDYKVVLYQLVGTAIEALSYFAPSPEMAAILTGSWTIVIIDKDRDGKIEDWEIQEVLESKVRNKIVKTIMDTYKTLVTIEEAAKLSRTLIDGIEKAASKFPANPTIISVAIAPVVGIVGYCYISPQIFSFFGSTAVPTSVPIFVPPGLINIDGLSVENWATRSSVQALCPVDLMLSTGSGLVLNKTINQIPGSKYIERDFDVDGDMDPLIILPDLTSNYTLRVVPKPSASGKDTYTLSIGNDWLNIVLQNQAKIENISQTGLAVQTYSKRDDNTPPYISGISRTPPWVQPYQNVTIKVNVTDSQSGVQEVMLCYNTDNGSIWENVTMSHLEMSTWIGNITGFPAGTRVQYKIIARDYAGNVAIVSETEYVYIIIPEFPSAIILSLFMIVTLLVVVFARRKTLRKPKT